jgi:glycosyltransferase involved in cell wall biosynthesis
LTGLSFGSGRDSAGGRAGRALCHLWGYRPRVWVPSDERCEELGIADKVHFVGAVHDMRKFYAAADVICVPSRGEPLGRTVIEAFAQRRAIVATATGGIPESVVDGETGLLVEFGAVASLVRSLRKLRSDPSLRARLVENAWRVAQDRNHAAGFASQLGQFLNRIGLVGMCKRQRHEVAEERP